MAEISWDLEGNDKTAFTKFPVGTTHIRILDDAPHIRWIHWLDNFRKSINCPGMKVCPIDDIMQKQKANGEKQTYTRARKFAMNVYNYETGKLEIMEQGITFMEDVKMIMSDLQEDGRKLSEVKIKVRRTGTGKDDTKYRLDIAEDVTEPIPAGVTDLLEYFKPATPEQITKLLAVSATSVDEYNKAWTEIMTTEEKQEDNSSDEEVEVK